MQADGEDSATEYSVEPVSAGTGGAGAALGTAFVGPSADGDSQGLDHAT